MQKDSESEPVCDQKQRHYHGWKKVSGSQLPRQESSVIGLVESIQDIYCTPEIGDP